MIGSLFKVQRGKIEEWMCWLYWQSGSGVPQLMKKNLVIKNFNEEGSLRLIIRGQKREVELSY